ncbi:MAG: hypothetical protein IJ335_05090 [Lachnospiraceae bacterium]|nr:hypothetical protein [Lachnospiraceae bacterium]
MRIHFQTQNMQELTTQVEHHKEKNISAPERKDYRVSLFADNTGLTMEAGNVEKGKSLIEIQQAAGNMDAAVTQDYMTLMSHTMSPEDYARAQEEGFDFSGADPEEVVTIVDKIKAELVKAGVCIQGYTDDLSMEQLSAALGSEGLAKAIQSSFGAADIPLDNRNLQEIKAAWDMAVQLQELSQGDLVYLTDNQLKPEIWNLYLAQNSGADRVSGNGPKFFHQEIKGYVGVNGAHAAQTTADMDRTIDKRLEQLGVEKKEENHGQARWLLEKGLAVTEENLSLMKEYGKLQLPVSEEQFAGSVAAAVSMGKKPTQANLLEQETIYTQANRVLEYYQSENSWQELAGDITGRRQLEEVRLRMTAEVNVKLIRSGFAIDTAPMEQLVEALKQAEAQVAQSLFPQSMEPVEQYHLYQRTNVAVQELPGFPVQILNRFLEEQSPSLDSLHQEGAQLQRALKEANASYETLMTAPRRDLGDSIKKAFAGVEQILADMGMEATEEYQKAVRTLGYNRMPINEENVQRILQAQERVETVLKKMTPASTLQMIRDGINPLETDFDQLERYLDSRSGSYEKEAESYARFLYGLEMNHEITPAERESYIGIYRLIRQIEKSDGAAVGALVNTGAQLQLSNLLAAVRSSKFRGMDVRADDTIGMLEQLVEKGESISGQIAKAFLSDVKDVLTDVSENMETRKAYEAEQLQQLREATQVSREAVELLERGQIPLTASNLLASDVLLKDASNPFRALRDKAQQLKASKPAELEDIMKQEAGQIFTAAQQGEEILPAYEDMIDRLQEQVEEETFRPDVDITSLDVKELQMYHKQLTILGNVAGALSGTGQKAREEYMMPMYIGEQLTRVHLTVEKKQGQKGLVDIRWNGEDGEQLRMRLQLSGKVLTWSMEGNAAAGLMERDKIADILGEVAGEHWQVKQEAFTMAGQISSRNTGSAWLKNHLSMETDTPELPAEEEAADNTELYRVARMALQAIERGMHEN